MTTMIKYLVVLAWLCFSPNVFSAQQEAIDWQNKELIIKLLTKNRLVFRM